VNHPGPFNQKQNCLPISFGRRAVALGERGRQWAVWKTRDTRLDRVGPAIKFTEARFSD
jgi:hypothetical protein